MGAMTTQPEIRTAHPGDYDRIAAVMDSWWGRPIRSGLPRLFLDHFPQTSLVAESDGELAGFLVGFLSPARPDTAYIHFVGVAPEARRSGLAGRFYERFSVLARAAGRSRIRAITSPVNTRSEAFHRALGFTVSGPFADYDGPGADRLVFERNLEATVPGSAP